MIATVVGGGLAGSEAAWALAERGVRVTLLRDAAGGADPGAPHRPPRRAGLHQHLQVGGLTNAHGLLKAEMRALGSLLLPCADEARVPGGTALAVDREVFSARGARAGDRRIPNITVVREEAAELPAPGVVATGPLTSERLAAAIAARLGVEALAFYDAIAPVVADDSLDHERLYALSRYGKGGGDDYLNAAARPGRRTRRSSTRCSRPTSTRATTSTRCRTSRAACRSRRWRGAAARRCASGR